MESPSAENLSSVRENVMESLVQGHAYAAQLQILLERTESGHQVTKILSSFKKALSILNSSTEFEEVPVSSSCQDQRRKRFKGRKMQETSTKITVMPIEDGYAWRKYGRKEILNAKHLRCYYRCSYKSDTGCQATKQVQKIKEEPSMFCTKYIGHHTCQFDVLKASFCMDSTAEEGLLLNFEPSTPTKQDPPFFSSFPPSKEKHIKSFPSKQESKPSSSEYLPPQGPTKFKSFIPTSPLPLTALQSGHGDVVLGCNTSSSSSLDMVMELMDSDYFNDVFSLLNDDELS